MPKDNPLLTDIHALYKRQIVHVMIYTYIRGIRRGVPSLSAKESAKAFIKDFEIFVDGYSEKEVIDIYNIVHRDILNKGRYGKRETNKT